MTARNDARNASAGTQRWEYRFSFDPLCAYCTRPIPDNAITDVLWRLGWTQERDGTWVCGSCSKQTPSIPPHLL